jgi:replicative DNA helicase
MSRELPHNRDAEDQVVGGILFRGRDELVEVHGIIEPEDFYDARHEAIFQAFLDLDSKGRGIDLILVADQMRENGTLSKLEASGREAYLTDLANRVGVSYLIGEHAQLIRETASARRVLLAASKIVEEGYSPGMVPVEYVERAEELIFAAGNRKKKAPFLTLGQALHKNIEQIEARSRNGTGITGVATGYGKFDEMTAGLQRGSLILVAARPSMGKTSLAVNFAQNSASTARVPALIFSLEMIGTELSERILSAEARVDSLLLRSGQLGNQWTRVLEACNRLYDLPIVIEDTSSPTIEQMKAVARRWRADKQRFPNGLDDLGLIIIDYLQLASGGGGSDKNREREISVISRGLKGLAKDLNLPVVALSQLNRDVEGRDDHRPQIHDLRESGSLEQDADLVCVIYRDEMYFPDSPDIGIAELIIRKQRNGPTGTVRLAFLKEYTRFENLSERREPT